MALQYPHTVTTFLIWQVASELLSPYVERSALPSPVRDALLAELRDSSSSRQAGRPSSRQHNKIAPAELGSSGNLSSESSDGSSEADLLALLREVLDRCEAKHAFCRAAHVLFDSRRRFSPRMATPIFWI